MIEEYLWAIETFQNEIDKGTFELYAGDCYLKDVKEHLDKKDLFFMKHYIKDIENVVAYPSLVYSINCFSFMISVLLKSLRHSLYFSTAKTISQTL